MQKCITILESCPNLSSFRCSSNVINQHLAEALVKMHPDLYTVTVGDGYGSEVMKHIMKLKRLRDLRIEGAQDSFLVYLPDWVSNWERSLQDLRVSVSIEMVNPRTCHHS
jgi:hypothetical protein